MATVLADILGWFLFIAMLFGGLIVVVCFSMLMICIFWREPLSDWEEREHERAEIFSRHLEN